MAAPASRTTIWTTSQLATTSERVTSASMETAGTGYRRVGIGSAGVSGRSGRRRDVSGLRLEARCADRGGGFCYRLGRRERRRMALRVLVLWPPRVYPSDPSGGATTT